MTKGILHPKQTGYRRVKGSAPKPMKTPPSQIGKPGRGIEKRAAANKPSDNSVRGVKSQTGATEAKQAATVANSTKNRAKGQKPAKTYVKKNFAAKGASRVNPTGGGYDGP